MKTIQIQANSFFELLKTHDASMWEIFAQMIDGEDKTIIFINTKEEVLFHYPLPKTLEQLQEDQKTFAQEFAERLGR